MKRLTSRSNDAALPDRREQSETDGERHRDGRRVGGQEHRIGETRRDLRQHIAAVGERMAEIAVQRAEQPVEEPQDRRPVEAEVEAQLGEAFGRRRILQDRRREIARQNFRADEDQHGGGEQCQDAEAQPLENKFQHDACPLAFPGLAGTLLADCGCGRRRPSAGRVEAAPAPRERAARALVQDLIQAFCMM